jgi:hypothetical protein
LAPRSIVLLLFIGMLGACTPATSRTTVVEVPHLVSVGSLPAEEVARSPVLSAEIRQVLEAVVQFGRVQEAPGSYSPFLGVDPSGVDGGRLVPAAGRVNGFVVVASSDVAGFNGSVLCLWDFVQAPCAPEVEGWRVHVNRDTMALLRFDIDLGATHSLTVVSLVDFDNRDPFPADQAVTWMTPGWTPPTDNGWTSPDGGLDHCIVGFAAFLGDGQPLGSGAGFLPRTTALRLAAKPCPDGGEVVGMMPLLFADGNRQLQPQGWPRQPVKASEASLPVHPDIVADPAINTLQGILVFFTDDGGQISAPGYAAEEVRLETG